MSRDLHFDTRCNNKLFSESIKILEAMTGIKWGFMRRRHRIQYISSIEIPVTIGSRMQRRYAERPHDYKIANIPGSFAHDEWIEHLKCELKNYMLTVVKDPAILDRIRGYVIVSKTATLYDDAAEFNKKYNTGGSVTDAWLSGTEFTLIDEIPYMPTIEEEPLGDW